MAALTLGLLLLAAVLVSAVVDQLVPRISLPLIQIAIGVAVALVAGQAVNIDLDPELFLVLFIAPLLFDEAKHADKASLWEYRVPILSLAIGLVLVTTLAIGFAVNYFIPSIPLAAAFALGAALGPTDAVAVSSLSHTTNIPARQKAILKGELLLNDASGIVSFQFALAAVITGTFSLWGASVELVYSFVGGLVLGVALGWLGSFIVRRVRDIGVENTTFHVLFEVFVPFLVFLIAEACHVSGIIAVVVAGLMNVVAPRAMTPAVSRMNIVSSSVWKVLAFALNGVVFVLLGTQLPSAMHRTWDDASISNPWLLAYVLGITFILFFVRFLWVLGMELVGAKSQKRPFCKRDVRNALITTFSGAKGTITLSIMFTIPLYAYYSYELGAAVPFPQRDLLIFLACGTILCSLLLATFLVPLLAPNDAPQESEDEQRQRDVSAYLDILRGVVEELTARQNKDNELEVRAVIANYNARIEHVKEVNDIEDEPNVKLRLQALSWEEERVNALLGEDAVSPLVAYRYLGRLERVCGLLTQGGRVSTRWHSFVSRLRLLFRRGVNALVHEIPAANLPKRAEETRRLQVQVARYVIEKLEEAVASSTVPTEDAAGLLLEYQRTLSSLVATEAPIVSTTLEVASDITAVRRLACQLELEKIQELYEEGAIDRGYVRRLRDNVVLMQLDVDDRL